MTCPPRASPGASTPGASRRRGWHRLPPAGSPRPQWTAAGSAGVPGDADKPTVFATGTTGQARLAALSAIARRNCLTTNRGPVYSGPSSSARDTASLARSSSRNLRPTQGPLPPAAHHPGAESAPATSSRNRSKLSASSGRSECPAAFSRLHAVDLRRSATAAGIAVKAHYDVDRRGDGGASGLPREASARFHVAN